MQCVSFLQVCDPHLTGVSPKNRLDDYFDALCAKLNEAVYIANHNDAYLLFMGDLVHKYDIAPEVINVLLRILRKARKRVFSVLGNHDVYGHNADAAKDKVIIGNLFASGVVTLLSKAPQFVEENGVIVQLTGVSYHVGMDHDASDYFINKVQGVHQAIHVLHSYLVDRPWPKHDGYTLLQDVVTEANIIATGHEHLGFGIFVRDDGVIFSNPGALGRVNCAMSEMNRMPTLTLFKCFKEYNEAHVVRLSSVRPSIEVLNRAYIEAEEARESSLASFTAETRVRLEVADLPTLIDVVARIDNVDPAVRAYALELISIVQQRFMGA